MTCVDKKVKLKKAFRCAGLRIRCFCMDPDPVFKFLGIRVRFVLRGWIWIRIRFVPRGWIRIRIRIRSISDRIRNPADADYDAGVTNLKPYVNPKITRFQDEREIFYLEIPSFLVLSILFLIEGFFVNFTKYVININGHGTRNLDFLKFKP